MNELFLLTLCMWLSYVTSPPSIDNLSPFQKLVRSKVINMNTQPRQASGSVRGYCNPNTLGKLFANIHYTQDTYSYLLLIKFRYTLFCFQSHIHQSLVPTDTLSVLINFVFVTLDTKLNISFLAECMHVLL